jgi:hypothetical protein
MRVDESMYYSHDYDMILRLARTNEGVFIDDPVLYQRKHLSYRRPSAERTFILDTVGKWVKHDALLFNKLDREWSLSDFRPFSRQRGPRHAERPWRYFRRASSCSSEKSTTEQHARSWSIAVTLMAVLPILWS